MGRPDATGVRARRAGMSALGGRLRLIAVLEASDATRRILRNLNLPTEVPPTVAARAPPGADDWAA